MAAMSMDKAITLGQLLGQMFTLGDASVSAIPVSGISLDSRKVVRGDMFIALPGSAADGRQYIDAAIANGAVAVLVENDASVATIQWRENVPVIAVNTLAEKVSDIAGRFFAEPSASMQVVGVTGTNGKTSCVRLIQQLLKQCNEQCGVMGTLGNGLSMSVSEAINTTPDAIQVQRLLADWLAQGVRSAAMEVSSHALIQRRVDAVQFATAVFTNLSRDHLDYHGDMASYGAAKSKLFTRLLPRSAVINIDDSFGQKICFQLADGTQLLRYSVDDKNADLYLSDITYASNGVRAQLHSPWGVEALFSPLLGEFNLSNLLAAIAAVTLSGQNFSAVVAACASLQPITGRMQRVEHHSDIDVVIDYAHTPDALEKALQAMRIHCAGKLWCVFGCGGDRDKGKRPQMGKIAAQLADFTVVTSDNPRGESAQAIIDDILSGSSIDVLVEADRADAIALAIGSAQPGDSILIAGKGHEQYQQIGIERLPFDDASQARLALSRRAST